MWVLEWLGPPFIVGALIALSTWSGTLAPSDWDGGCQSALYTVKAVAGIQTTEAAWFRCSSG